MIHVSPFRDRSVDGIAGTQGAVAAAETVAVAVYKKYRQPVHRKVDGRIGEFVVEAERAQYPDTRIRIVIPVGKWFAKNPYSPTI